MYIDIRLNAHAYKTPYDTHVVLMYPHFKNQSRDFGCLCFLLRTNISAGESLLIVSENCQVSMHFMCKWGLIFDSHET